MEIEMEKEKKFLSLGYSVFLPQMRKIQFYCRIIHQPVKEILLRQRGP